MSRFKQFFSSPLSIGISLGLLVLLIVPSITRVVTQFKEASGYGGGIEIGVGYEPPGSSHDGDCDVSKTVSPTSGLYNTTLTYTIKIECTKSQSQVTVKDTMGNGDNGYILGDRGGQVTFLDGSLKVTGIDNADVSGDIDQSGGIKLRHVTKNDQIVITYEAVTDDTGLDSMQTSDVDNTVSLSTDGKASATFTLRGRNLPLAGNCSHSASTRFIDVPITHWAECYISQLVDMDVVHGYGDGRYGPDNLLTRAEAVKIALRVNYKPVMPGSDLIGTYFTDVKPGAWYTGYVNTARDNGIIHGYEDGSFKPDRPVTRAEFMKIILRAAGLGTSSLDVVLYPDVQPTDWFWSYVNFASLNKIVNGFVDGTFGPNLNINRAEAAKMVVNTKHVSDSYIR